MIINSKGCCYNCFSPNRNFLLKVNNKGTLSILVILQYSIYGGTVTRYSEILNQGEGTRLTFQESAINICFNIVNESLPNRPIICNGCIPSNKSSCYEVRGTVQNPICVNVPC